MFGVFDPDYARHYVIRNGLERVGCRVTLHRLPPGTSSIAALPHVLSAFPRLAHEHDLFFVPAFNQLLAPFIWAVSRLYSRPVLLDYMVGLTDANEDRQTVAGVKATLFRWIDCFNIQRMYTLTDTEAHRKVYERLLGCRVDRMRIVPVGVRDMLMAFEPSEKRDRDTLVIQFVGTYIPFHGVDVIIRAAHLLRENNGVRFELIGQGQTYTQSVALAQELELSNVRFIPGFFQPHELRSLCTHSSIVLGVFGDVAKTRYVVPIKVYEGLGLGLPVVTAESPALNEFFTPGEHLLTVMPGNPEALAIAIMRLVESPEERARVGIAGAARIREAFLPEHIGVQLKAIVETIISR